jgi:cell division septation protein DedD
MLLSVVWLFDVSCRRRTPSELEMKDLRERHSERPRARMRPERERPMHTEENQPPAKDFRYESAAQDTARPAHTQESGGALASQPRAEEWSAFTPASDGLEDILLIPEEPLEASEPLVQVEVLEDVFAVEAAPSPTSSAESPAAVGGRELQAGVDEGIALQTSLAPSEGSAQGEPAPVESLRAPAPSYDKYAVGMRILRISPAWMLLSTFGFLSVIIIFGWMSRPAGQVEASALEAGFKNAATNQSPTPAQDAAPQAAPAVAAEPPAPAAKAAEPAKEEPTQEPSQEQPKQPQAAQAQEVKQPAGATAQAGNFTLQVGSYNDLSQANERVSALRAAGVEARAASVEIPKRGTWYRVQAGRFQTREEAARFGAQLRAKGAAESAFVAELEKR